MLNSVRFFRFAFFYLTTGLLLSACGGGGGSTEPVAVVAPPVATGPTWTKDVFEAAANFKDRCEAPRSGINPATGSAYPDIAGSTLYENHWLRSWSNDTYLWYDEIEDQNPANFTSRTEYFDVLKTNAITSSGSQKDNFHGTRNTAEYQELVSSGTLSGYGADLELLRRTVPRELRVSLVQPNTPAANAPASLQRGTEILEIDGVDVVNANTQAEIDILNAGLFPASDNEVHTFLVRDIGSPTTRSFSMTSGTFETQAVLEAKTIDTPTGDVGYILYDTFGLEKSEVQIVDAITQLSNSGVQDLVLDLRYNGGGFLLVSAQVGYLIAGNKSLNQTFFQQTYNDKITPVSPVPFINTGVGLTVPGSTVLPSLNLDRVFILSTAGTCSGSEAVINALRGIDVEVILIGTRTCGKPYGFAPTDNCGETYFTIQFKGDNAKGFGEYSDGFTPMDAVSSVGELITGCEVSDDYLNQLGSESEAMLATALSYRESGECPVNTTLNTINKQAGIRDRPMSLYEKLNDYEEGSLYNSDYVRDRILLEIAINESKK